MVNNVWELGMVMERGGEGPKDGVFVLTPLGFVLPQPHPLGPREALPHLVKLYFLLIFLTTSTIFLMNLFH